MATKSKSKSPSKSLATKSTVDAKGLKNLIKKKISKYSNVNETKSSFNSDRYLSYSMTIVGGDFEIKIEGKTEREVKNFLIAGLNTLEDIKDEENW